MIVAGGLALVGIKHHIVGLLYQQVVVNALLLILFISAAAVAFADLAIQKLELSHLAEVEKYFECYSLQAGRQASFVDPIDLAAVRNTLDVGHDLSDDGHVQVRSISDPSEKTKRASSIQNLWPELARDGEHGEGRTHLTRRRRAYVVGVAPVTLLAA